MWMVGTGNGALGQRAASHVAMVSKYEPDPVTVRNLRQKARTALDLDLAMTPGLVSEPRAVNQGNNFTNSIKRSYSNYYKK